MPISELLRVWTIRVVAEPGLDPLGWDWGLQAADQFGNRYGYCGPASTRTRSEALALAERVHDHHRRKPAWTPIGNKHWYNLDLDDSEPDYEADAYEADRARWRYEERHNEVAYHHHGYPDLD